MQQKCLLLGIFLLFILLVMWLGSLCVDCNLQVITEASKFWTYKSYPNFDIFYLNVQIRLQLETLLAEKARLAHENSIYARENRFLREVVEYHQLTMQDVVYLDESTEEVTEVYPIKVPSLPNMNSMPATSGILSYETPLDTSLQISRNISVHPVPPPEFVEGS